MDEIKKDQEVKEESAKPEENESESMKSSFKKKLAKKDEEVNKAKDEMEHWKNEYYRAYADMANLRKDIQRDHEEIKKYRIEGFVDDLVSVLDAFDMAFKSEPKNPETKNYLQGFVYVYGKLIELLKQEGVEIIDPKVGDKFNEKTMHAIETVDDEGEENVVKGVTCKGYKLYDHLIRAAMVMTSKHPSKDENVDKKNVA